MSAQFNVSPAKYESEQGRQTLVFKDIHAIKADASSTNGA